MRDYYSEVPKIYVCGNGICTVLGADSVMCSYAYLTGMSRLSVHPFMIDIYGEEMTVARAEFIEEDLFGAERMIKLASPAFEEVMQTIEKQNTIRSSFPLVLGLPAFREGFTEKDARSLLSKLKEICKAYPLINKIIPVFEDQTAGYQALKQGIQMIKKEESLFCLIGGIESMIHPVTLEWLDGTGQLRNSKNKWGTIPGEGAGFCLLANEHSVREHNLPSTTRVVGVSTATEKNLPDTDTPVTGESLSKAIRKLLLLRENADNKINNIVCDLNGDRYRTDEYGFTLGRLGEHFRDGTDYFAPTEAWGDIGVASATCYIMLTNFLAEKKRTKGKYNLIFNGAPNGKRVAVLLDVNTTS